jgi:hypothetical protein
MSVPRNLIELALDEIASDEGGMRFQGLAVVLAKLRWPELVACERKKDLGLDAYASASVSPAHVGMGLSCSITTELGKIKEDADRAKPHFPDLKVLVFATSGKVTNDLAKKWKEQIKKDYGWDLIVMSREDIITSLQIPENASLCSTHLGIAVPTLEQTTEALLEIGLAATSDVIAAWSKRMDGHPVINLRLARLDDRGAETQETVQSGSLNALLLRSQRIVIEGPAGRGKTTTLIQLAREHRAAGRIACLVDLPAWVRRNVGIFDFLAGMVEFQSRGLMAGDLARIDREQHFTFLLNGWNELVPSESADAARLIRDLERSFPVAGIAVATRGHPVTPPLPGSSRFKIQTLTTQEREAYLRGRLKERAGKLITLLNADPVLSDLTTTPMILAEVTSLFEAGKPIPASKLGVLDAVTRLMENSEKHQAALVDAPLSGMARRYLEELGTWLVANGGVQITESQARKVISSVGRELLDSGETGTPSDPGGVLTALCSHHVLERSTYPDISYSFFHQQFQELFAALRLMRELAEIAATGVGHAEFASKYVNEPAWSQPLYMLAEFIGGHTEDEPLPDGIAMGKELIDMALPIDAVLAAELARLCGADVWAAVRGAVGARLRQLYQSQSSMSRESGLAAMLASGFDDFKDVIVPLLSSQDDSVRLDTYRAWQPFRISSLGKQWKQTVRGWNEKARADFASESIRDVPLRAEAISFCLADPSARVQQSVISAVGWVMSPEDVAQFSETLNDDLFASLIEYLPMRFPPSSIRSRAAAAYTRIAETSTDANQRLAAWSEAARLGKGDAIGKLKLELSGMNAEQVGKLVQRNLESIVDLIRTTDAEWVTAWVTQGILAGTLHGDSWVRRVSGIPTGLRDELLDRVTTEDLSEKRVPGVIPLLRAFPDAEIVKRLFRRLCELRPVIATSRPGDDKQSEAKLARQLEDLLREMSPNMVVESILQELGGNTGAPQIEVIAEIFHVAGRAAPPLREVLSAKLREEFCSYLKSAMATVLVQDDPQGQVKAQFATVLAQVGEASDLSDIERLIRADLERFRAEQSARIAASTRSRRGARP